MDKTVEQILKWLQMRFQNTNRITREEVDNGLAANPYESGILGSTQKPQPFQIAYDASITGYTRESPQLKFYEGGNGNNNNGVSSQKVTPISPFSTPGSRPYTPYGVQYTTTKPFTPASSSSPLPYSDQGSSLSPYSPTVFAYSPTVSSVGEFGLVSSTPDDFRQDSSDFNDAGIGLADVSSNAGAVADVSSTTFATTGGEDARALFFSNQGTDKSAASAIVGNGFPTSARNDADDDLHPPHIHAIDVKCSKDRMTINLEFNKIYNGVIYSKGYYNEPNCQYIAPNSGQLTYSFVVQLNSCGTQFVNEFDKGKQAYLENVLVLQNEPGIQEVWDTIRSVRCLWEGSIKQTLSAGLNVDTINQDILTFSGDTVTARLDIRVGKGPNAQPANGLVKIGEPMTLVVTVDGDAAFDVLVRSCVATDGVANSNNVIQLTDDQGCLLKPKLFGSFQTIKDTSDPEKPKIVSFAYFQAFKFPDIMDLIIECNVELCKTNNCQTCQQNVATLSRKKRALAKDSDGNVTNVLAGKTHVYSPDDLLQLSSSSSSSSSEAASIVKGEMMEPLRKEICFTVVGFYLSYGCVLALFVTASTLAANYWLSYQRMKSGTKITNYAGRPY